MNKKMTKVIGIVAVLALVAVAFVGAGAATTGVSVDNSVILVGGTATFTASGFTDSVIDWTVTQTDTFVTPASIAEGSTTFTVTGLKAGTYTVTAKGHTTTSETVTTSSMTVNTGVAEVGSTKYPTFAKALTGVGSSGIIKMLANVTDAQGSIPAYVTLDLDEYTITLSGDLTVDGTIKAQDKTKIAPDGNIITLNGTSTVVFTNSPTSTLSDFGSIVGTSGTIKKGAVLKADATSTVTGKWWVVTAESVTPSSSALQEGVNTSDAREIAISEGSTTVVGLEQAISYTYYIPASVSMGSLAVTYPFEIKVTVPTASTYKNISMSLTNSAYFDDTNSKFRLQNATAAGTYVDYYILIDDVALTTKTKMFLTVADSSTTAQTKNVKFSGDVNGQTGITASKAGNYADYLTFTVEPTATITLGGTWNVGEDQSIEIPVGRTITFTPSGSAGTMAVTIGETEYTAGTGSENITGLTFASSEISSGYTVVKTGTLAYTTQ